MIRFDRRRATAVVWLALLAIALGVIEPPLVVGAGESLSIYPAAQPVFGPIEGQNRSFTVQIRVDSGQISQRSASFDLGWDPSLVEFVRFDKGSSGGAADSIYDAFALKWNEANPKAENRAVAVAVAGRLDSQAGRYIAGNVGLVGAPGSGPEGSGLVGTVTFRALKEGTATITITRAALVDTNYVPISRVAAIHGTVVLGAPTPAPTQTPTSTLTPTPTFTPIPTFTATPTAVPSNTVTPTATLPGQVIPGGAGIYLPSGNAGLVAPIESVQAAPPATWTPLPTMLPLPVGQEVNASAVASLSLSKPAAPIAIYQQFMVDVLIRSDVPSRGAQCALSFDPGIIRVDKVIEGNFYKDWAAGKKAGTTKCCQVIDNGAGRVSSIGVSLVGQHESGPSGTGRLLTYYMTALAAGTSTLSLSDVVIVDAAANRLSPVAKEDITVAVGTGITPEVTPTGSTGISNSNQAPTHTATTLPAARSIVSVSPSAPTVEPGSSFALNVVVDTQTPIRSGQVSLSFDPKLLELERVEEGGFLKDWATSYGGFTSIFPQPSVSNDRGTVSNAGVSVMAGARGGVTGSGTLFVFHMRAKPEGSGRSAITLHNVVLGDISARSIPGVFVTNGAAMVRGSTRASGFFNDGAASGSASDRDPREAGPAATPTAIPPTPIPREQADINADGVVNASDLASIYLRWQDRGAVRWHPSDLNGDGIVDVQDVAAFGFHWQ